ncbi:MAG: DUF4956 domain-containing protein [Alloprevotella sp.]
MDILSTLFAKSELLLPLLSSLLLNSITVWTVVHFFYYPKGHRRDYYFTFVLLSISIFMLIFLLLNNGEDMGIGAALGLFAIFGIIRYRTESVPIREMTYLFFLVALSVLNGKTGELGWGIRVVINAIFVAVVWVSENFLSAYREGCKFVKYDNIELIKPERYDELVADLEDRLGVKVLRVEIGAVDFLTDMTMLRVFYVDPEHQIKSVDRVLKLPRDNQFDN